MRLSAPAALRLLALLAVPDCAAAHGPHGDLPVPKLLGGGRRLLSEIMASARADMDRGAAPRFKAAMPEAGSEASRDTEKTPQIGGPKTREEMELEDPELQARVALRRRQTGGKSGQCGPGLGSCAVGYCCSPEGWCGLTPDYCSAPDCLINYGSGCDGNQKPSGLDTSAVPRPHVGSVMYGGLGIYDCVTKGDIAVTFDDGPYNYTSDLLDKFASYGGKATFFITGNNLGKGMINDYSKPWANVIRRMVAEGHQVASHTWSHQNASQLTTQQYRNQILWNEIAFNDILGFFPTYMRPPYSICEAGCQKILSELGYHITYFDLDTEGYLHDDPTLIQDSKDIWDEAIDRADSASAKFLMIEHDIHYQTVYTLIDYVLTSLFEHGFRSVTVGECLGDPKENWYRQGPGGSGGSGGGGGSSAPSSQPGPSASPKPSIPSTTIRKKPSKTAGGSGSVRTDDSIRGTATAAAVSTPAGKPPGTSGAPTSLVPDLPIKPNPATAPAAPAASATTSATPSPIAVVTAVPSGAGIAAPLKVTVDGNCGSGITCVGSRFGNCCSHNGWCGSSADYCGSTCQPQFGACSDAHRP